MPNSDKSSFITTGGRVRNYLLIAFVLSLFVHFLVAPFMKVLTQQSEEQQVEKVSVTKRIQVKPPTPPPPTPTPPPPKSTPPPKQQQQQQQVQLKVNPPKTNSNSNAGPSETKYVPPQHGSEEGNPNGAATGAPATTVTAGPPASTPTPKPACANPYQDAQATQKVTPDYPDAARESGMGKVEVNVVVSLSASGTVTGATVQNPSGSMAMDQAATMAAKQSVYTPKLENCQPVASQYIYTVTFDPEQ